MHYNQPITDRHQVRAAHLHEAGINYGTVNRKLGEEVKLLLRLFRNGRNINHESPRSELHEVRMIKMVDHPDATREDLVIDLIEHLLCLDQKKRVRLEELFKSAQRAS